MPFSLIPPSDLDRTSLFHQGGKEEKLEILYSDAEADLVDDYVIYRGGVRAKYGVTTLTTDTLVVRRGKPGDGAVELKVGGNTFNLRPMEAYAVGKVQVVDPDGTIRASNLWFTWDKARRDNSQEEVGRAEDVDVHISTVWIKADKMTQSKAGLNFSKVGVATSNWKTPLYKFDAESIFVVPGKQATARNVRLSILGVQLPPLPRFVFSLDPRANGLQIPRIGFRQGAGLGMSWGGDFIVNDSTDVLAAFNAYPKVQPTYMFAYSKSNIPAERAGLNQFAITDQFGERSIFSFFGNVYTQRLEDGYERIRIPKSLFSVSSSFNYETLGRVTDRQINYSRPLEVGYELGGPIGGWGYLVQARASRIVEGGGQTANRLFFQGNLFTPLVKSGRFTAGTRVDGALRLDASSSGYLGAEGGFSYEPKENLRFSAGLYGYHNFGTSLFAGDNFVTNQGYVVRGDWFGTSNNLSIMFRYDPTQGWFDKEYRISQVMGSVEPVIAYRESPRQYQLGLRFRTQDIARMLQKRKIQRLEDTKEDGKKGGLE